MHVPQKLEEANQVTHSWPTLSLCMCVKETGSSPAVSKRQGTCENGLNVECALEIGFF